MALKPRFLGPPTQIPVDPPPGSRHGGGGPARWPGIPGWTGPGIHPILSALVSHLTGAATPNTGFAPQTWDGVQTGNYNNTTAGGQIGDYLAGAHPALANGGNPIADGGAGNQGAAAAGGLSWLPGWTPNPGQDISGRTPYNTGAHWIATHGIWGTPGQDPLTSLTALRNAMRQARGNTSVWAPPTGYVPHGAAAMFQPGVAPSAWGAMPDYHPPAT